MFSIKEANDKPKLVFVKRLGYNGFFLMEYKLYLDTGNGELPLARKPVMRHNPEEAPSNPSRFYMLVILDGVQMGWMNGHLGCDNRGHPKIHFRVQEDSRLSVSSQFSIPEDRGVARIHLPYLGSSRSCPFLINGCFGFFVDLCRRNDAQVIMRVLTTQIPLRVGFAPLMVGPREFSPPENMNGLFWHEIR